MSIRFRLRKYRLSSGACPVGQFLTDLEDERPQLYPYVIAGINKIRDQIMHRSHYVRSLSPSPIWELRVNQARILFDYEPDQLIVLLLGTIKKGDKLPRRIIEQAEDYMEDYRARCGGEDDGSDEQF